MKYSILFLCLITPLFVWSQSGKFTYRDLKGVTEEKGMTSTELITTEVKVIGDKIWIREVGITEYSETINVVKTTDYGMIFMSNNYIFKLYIEGDHYTIYKVIVEPIIGSKIIYYNLVQ